MNLPRIMLFGGCHVSGYLVGQANAFPAQLNQLLDGQIVGQVSHVRFIDLPKHLQLIDELQPSHVVLQLGNHEFSASPRQMMRQFTRALGMVPAAKKATSALPKASASPKAKQSASPDAFFHGRVLCLSILTTLLWLLSGQYRRSFHELNECMQRNPGTAFIFLSPFPCLPPADNALRDFGGWLLRRRLAASANRHWFDSHRLLHPSQELFADPWHLNGQAHKALAYSLAGFLHSITGHSAVAA